MNHLKVSHQNHVAQGPSWHYYQYFVVLTYKLAGKTHSVRNLIDHKQN